MKKSWSTKFLCQGAAIAGLYAALTILLAPISFGANGALQLRVSEALTLLPMLTPAAVPGLFVGCLAANLICGAPLADIVFGSLATLLAALLTRRLRKTLYLAALPPVLCNGVIVGVVLSVVYSVPLFYSCLTVAGGEALACYVLGIPLLKGVEKLKIWN